MPYHISIAFLAFLLLTGPCRQARTGSAAELQDLAGQSVVFYNVENLFDTLDDPRTNDDDFLPGGRYAWTGERYARKQAKLAEAIAWAGGGLPVMIGLSEVENAAVVKELASTPPLDGGYTLVHQDSPDRRGIDVALLYRGSHLREVENRSITVRLGRGSTRDILYVLFTVAGGERLHVWVNHWPSRWGGREATDPSRAVAARTLRKDVDRVLSAEPDARLLIMGDLNDEPPDHSVAMALGAATDTSGTADLVNLMARRKAGSALGTFNHQGDWSILDHFIVSPALLCGRGRRPCIAEARIFWDERLLFKHPRFGLVPDRTYSGDRYIGNYSDHLPIVLRFQ